jgi:hypothetical protein
MELENVEKKKLKTKLDPTGIYDKKKIWIKVYREQRN